MADGESLVSHYLYNVLQKRKDRYSCNHPCGNWYFRVGSIRKNLYLVNIDTNKYMDKFL
jgi:hypothetical protein